MSSDTGSGNSTDSETEDDKTAVYVVVGVVVVIIIIFIVVFIVAVVCCGQDAEKVLEYYCFCCKAVKKLYELCAGEGEEC